MRWGSTRAAFVLSGLVPTPIAAIVAVPAQQGHQDDSLAQALADEPSALRTQAKAELKALTAAPQQKVVQLGRKRQVGRGKKIWEAGEHIQNYGDSQAQVEVERSRDRTARDEMDLEAQEAELGVKQNIEMSSEAREAEAGIQRAMAQAERRETESSESKSDIEASQADELLADILHSQGADLNSMSSPAGGSSGTLGTPGACKCLNWARLFSERQVPYNVPLTYTKMDNNFCMSRTEGWAPGGDKGGTWCYVAAACKNLRGGESVNDKYSWKTCVAGSEVTLRDMHPLNLHAMALGDNIDLSALIRMAYPVVPVLWDERAVWPLYAQIVDSGLPVVIDSQKDHHGDKYIIAGKKAWRVRFNIKAYQAFSELPDELAQFPIGDMYQLDCIDGCGRMDSLLDP